MIQKIKELMQTREAVDKLNLNIQNNIKVVNELAKEILELKESFSNVKKQINKDSIELADSLKDKINAINSLREELQNEITNFKIFLSNQKKGLLEDLTKEFREEILNHTNNLKGDISSYNELKQQVSYILSQTTTLTQEIQKLKEISRNIRKEDFELTNFINKVTEMDKEKLRLMREIDTLQRLIAKSRRI